MEESKHLAINWTDGVKITQDHFFQSYFNTIENIKNASKISLNSFSYGLLSSLKNSNDSLEIVTHEQTEERIVLKLRSCHGITSNGCKIEFSTNSYGEELPTAILESNSFDKNANLQFYIIVVVNPYSLIPTGEPDPEAIPLHHPNSLSKIELKIISKSQFDSNYLQTYYLKVGNLKWKNGAFIFDAGYIPPVTKISYDKNLKSFYASLCQILVNLRNYSVLINRKNRDKLTKNKLAFNTNLLCEKILLFVSENLFEFNQQGAEQPPIFMANKISILANYIITSLMLLEEEEKEKLLQYFYEWTDIKPSVFETVLGNVMDLEYNHLEINVTISKLDRAMAIIERLFKKLSLLEYIGQRKDNIVISEETLSIREESKPNSWSIID